MNGTPRRRSGLPVLAILVVGALLALAAGLVVLARQQPALALSHEPGDLSRVTQASTTSLERFWTQQMPVTYDQPYTPLRGGYQPKTPDSQPWTCGGRQVTYEDVRGNAFYCGGPEDDYVAYDAADLFPRLNQVFGSVAPAIVLAHETGHAVQYRAEVQAPSIVIELQADCFAGAWGGYAQLADQDVTIDPSGLDSSVAAMLTLRDQPGTPATNPRAHGLGFDRVNAFQTGYESGTMRCARFPVDGVITTELPFRTAEEAATRGNVPYEVAVPLFTDSLDTFWFKGLPELEPGQEFAAPRRQAVPRPPLPECAESGAYDAAAAVGYCPDGNVVVWADSTLSEQHQRIGDLATGTWLSEAWGRAAQTQAGLPVDGPDAGLQRDCFTGAWVTGFAAQGLERSLLSPGDVDEVLATILASSFPPEGGRPDRGTAFVRTQALRAGVLGGLEACR